MREIKFRFWNKEMHCWEHDVAILIIEVLDGGEWKYIEDIEISQYTGLEDKNGREIYKGDILKIDNNFSNKTESIITEVIFSQGMFGVVWPKWGEKETLKISAFEVEVVGNVYENPELLGEVK